MLKLIIFDAGEILYKVEIERFYKIFRRFLTRNNALDKLKKQEVEWKKLEPKVLRGEISIRDANKIIFSKSGIPVELIDEFRRIDDEYVLSRKIIPGVKRVLNVLKKRYKLAILSNCVHQPEVRRKFYKHLGLCKYFDAIFLSNEIGYAKPDSMAYKLVLKRFNVKAGEAIFVGHDEKEIIGAKKVGIKTVMIGKSRTKADYRIKKLAELPKLLDEVDRPGFEPGASA